MNRSDADTARTDAFTRAADARSVAELRAAGWLKWTMFPTRIGAWVAESDFGTAPAIQSALHTAVDAGRLGYLTPAEIDAMGHAFADYAAAELNWTVQANRVRPVPDVLTAFRAAVTRFTSPGSAVILPTPGYMPFLTVPATMGRRVIEVPLIPGSDGRLVHDLAGIAAAFDDGGETLVLCNPQNPTGGVLDSDELLAIAEVVEAHHGRVFADEIHAPLVYPGRVHLPYASLNSITAGHTLTATSASKAWNIPGLKAAQVVLSSQRDAEVWATVGEEYEHPTATLGVVAATAAYTDGRQWLSTQVDYLDGNRRLLAELLAEHLPHVGYRMPEGTYLAWLDLRRLDIGTLPGPFLAERADVSFTDGTDCGAAGIGFIRLTMATPRPVLREIVYRIAAATADQRWLN